MSIIEILINPNSPDSNTTPLMMFILLCMISLALAEPPVRNNYVEAGQIEHDQAAHQQYLPPDLEVPSSRTPLNSLSNQYLPPSAREVSQKYGPPDSGESLTKEYGLPSQAESTFRSGISQEYGAPITRSSQYESPNSDLIQSFSSRSLKSGVSKRYGAPSSRNFPSNLYVPSSLRSLPSKQYSASNFNPSNDYKQQTSPVQKYGVPSFLRTQSNSRSTGQKYGTRTNSQSHQPQGLSDDISLRSQSSQYQEPRDLFETYGGVQYDAPAVNTAVSRFGKSTNSLQTTYGVPKGRTLNHYDGGYQNSRKSYLNTNAIPSSYSLARSPSLEYGAPSSRTMPSQEYGAPQQSLADEGYDYTRNALEHLNQEPANYEFAYKVSDDESGSNFGHTESRHQDKAEGTYFVLLPDGTKQVVEYEADEDGFKPRISVEPADPATAFAAEGPY